MDLREILSGSRGQVAAEIRAGRCTVAEIASALGMTDNNVRAHIASLQRDGIVRASGSRQGFRKPTITYSITDRAESLFARAYEPVLIELAAIISESGGDLRALFRQVGERLANGFGPLAGLSLDERLGVVAAAFRSLGAAPIVELEHGRLTIRGPRCPLANLVTTAPQACEIALTMVQTATGLEVQQHCSYSPHPVCCFTAVAS